MGQRFTLPGVGGCQKSFIEVTFEQDFKDEQEFPKWLRQE